MTTATPTKAASAPEATRKTKLRHAHFLTKIVFESVCHSEPAAAGEESHPARLRSRLACLDKKKLLAEFQKALILETAAKLGWTVQSRTELSAMQLGALCGALRKQMAKHDIAIPGARKSRRRRGEVLPEDPVSQEEQQLILDLLGRTLTERDWTQPQAEQWLRRQLQRWNLDWPETHGQARAIIGGLKAILRREPTAEQEPPPKETRP